MVTALSYGTTGLSVEQRVFGLTDWVRDGTLAEYVAVEARNLAPLPAESVRQTSTRCMHPCSSPTITRSNAGKLTGTPEMARIINNHAGMRATETSSIARAPIHLAAWRSRRSAVASASKATTMPLDRPGTAEGRRQCVEGDGAALASASRAS